MFLQTCPKFYSIDIGGIGGREIINDIQNEELILFLFSK